MKRPNTCDVLVVGAGPAGLAAATALRKQGVNHVHLIDRECEPGGIPRHCFHTGFGLFDLRRVLSGPSYASAHTKRALDAGSTIETECTAIDWNMENLSHTVTVTSPEGVREIAARAVLLATGCRERPRTAKRIPGTRPTGVYTTGSLQQLVHVHHQKPGTLAAVVGAEHVSYSAILTLLESGVSVAAMVTEFPRAQTYGPAHWWIAGRNRIPLLTNSTVKRVIGKDRVSGIEVHNHVGERTVECDTIVFTGDWIPDHEFCRTANVQLNPHTKGPDVDQALRTLTPGIFACGNLLRGAETADVASLEGTHAARSITDYLSNQKSWPAEDQNTHVEVRDPVQWISPCRVTIGGQAPARSRFTFRVSSVLPRGNVVVLQSNRTLYKRSFGNLIPNRWYTLAWGKWVSQIRSGNPLTVEFQAL